MIHDHPVLVCGAGAAGIAAALAAARAGADVVLAEAGPRPGGTVANALIHTIGGLYDAEGNILNGGLVEELATRLRHGNKLVRPRRMGRTWVLSACPEYYREVICQWLGEQSRIELCCNTRITSMETTGDIVRAVGVNQDGRIIKLPVRAVVDATGTAAVIRAIDPDLVMDDQQRSAGGVIVRLGGVTPGSLEFPKGIAVVRAIHSAAAENILPNECSKAWLDSGVAADEAYLKLLVSVPMDATRAELEDIHRRTVNVGNAVVAFLRKRKEFSNATVTATGRLGIRDGGRVVGEYCLTVDDVRNGARFDDAVCQCCWPIEFWDPDRGVELEYLPNQRPYDIPLRSLQVRNWNNVWAAGKILSADRLAQASARVAGCCWAMGEAAGKAAAHT